MKQFQYVVTVFLLFALVTTTAFAAKVGAGVATKKAVSKTLVGEEQPLSRSAHQKTVSEYVPFSLPPVPLSPSATPLHGTYRIGAGKDFTTISSALLSLLVNGVDGPTTFYFSAASYTESGLLILGPTGASAVNTVTFQPDSNTTGVTITLTDNATNGAGWAFIGSQYVTLNGTKKNGTPGNRDLTVQFDPAQTFPAGNLDAVIRVRDGASHVTVENTNVYSMYNLAQTDSRPGISMTAGSTKNRNITFDNNLITECSVGILTVGGAQEDTSLTITNNLIGSLFGTSFAGQLNSPQRGGIYAEYFNGANISGNQIAGIITNRVVATIAGTSAMSREIGIHVAFAQHGVISKNIIDSLAMTALSAGSDRRVYGIRNQGFASGTPGLEPPTWMTIKNNGISRLLGIGAISGGDISIECNPGRYDSILYNSMSATGTGLSGRAAVGMQLSGDNNTPAGDWVLNNVMSFTRTSVGGAASSPYRIFNNSGSPDVDSADGNVLYGPNYGINALDAAGNDINAWHAATGYDLHSSHNDPMLVSDKDLHLQSVATSSALQLAVPLASVSDDIDLQARGATPDAGFDQNGTTGTLADVGPFGLIVPSATGFPQGIPITSAKVRYYNYSAVTAAYTAHLVVQDPTTATLSTINVPVTGHAPFTYKDVDFSFSATPALLGAYPFLMSSVLVGDGDPSNDGPLEADVNAVPLTNGVNYTSGFESPADVAGWSADGDFVNDVPAKYSDIDWSLDALAVTGSANPAVGGHISSAHGGTKAWITNSTEWPDGLGYDNSTVSDVYTPFFDFTGYATRPYMSFYLSADAEPGFDVAVMEYSLDTGKTWHQLGLPNDPDGINWYNYTTYNNAIQNDTVPGAGVAHPGYGHVFANSDAAAHGFITGVTAHWASNGAGAGSRPTSDVQTGPFGWIYNELRLPTSFIGKNYVRFRMQMWGDGNSYGDGYAIDDFKIGTTGAPSTGSIAGKVYDDNNGNGVFDGGDAASAGVKVMLTGSKVDSAVTDGSGNFTFSSLPPGLFNLVQKAPPAGTATTVPANATGTYITSVAPGDVITGDDFGNYAGFVSGMKFDDVNNNGVNNSEPGVGGFVIEVHRDSVAGPLYAKLTTPLSGVWNVNVPPGTWGVTEINQIGYRQTLPLPNKYTVTTSGTSGTASSHFANLDFGDFRLMVAKLSCTVDRNGNGAYDAGTDNDGLPAATREYFELKKAGVHVGFDTLGNTNDFLTHTLDTGSYSWTILGAPPATWIRTFDNGGTVSFVVSTSGQLTTARYLDYEPPSVSGIKFNDLNGNGTKDLGEPGLSGWTINLAGVGSTVTDSNGFYQFLNVPGGLRALSETPQAGWQLTAPPPAQLNLNVLSKYPAGDIVRNLGNFHQISISGMKFRDRNGNGVKDPGDNGMPNWTINATNGGGSQLTDANGNYTFSNLGPGTYVLTEVAQVDYTPTAPVSGNYTIVASSGVNVTGRDFGNYQRNDSSKYRTWTYAELNAASEAKPVKRPKAGKPITAPPNSANMLTDLMSQPKITMGPVIQVGISAQLVGGKEKGYVLPAKQGDIYATLNSKSTLHTGAPRPLSFYNDGIKRILKRVKSLPASKANDVLVAQMLTFKINLAASAKGQTDPGLGLGNLIYCETGHAGLSGKSLTAISSYADSIMTNWDDRGLPGTPSAMWTDLNNVIAQINGAFSTGLTTDTALGWTSAKLTWVLKATAQSTSFLCAPGPGMAPASTPQNVPADAFQPLPTVYAVSQNYPNPFNPTTTISFDLPMNSLVTVKVYNMLGQEVTTLFNNEEIQAGTQDVDFDASALTSGVYFYRVTAQAVDDDGMTTGNTFTKTMKMMLVK